MGFFDNLANLFTGDSGVSAAKKSAAAATQAASTSAKKQTGLINTGFGDATTAISANAPLYQGATALAAPALQTYYGAIAGTPEQQAAARAEFQASPGYEYTLGQGLEGLARVGASTGQLGQADMDAMAFAHNLSDQDYQQWLSNLFAGTGLYEYGTSGQAATNTALANLDVNKATDLANIVANKYNTIGQAQAALPMNINAAQMAGAGNTLNALFGVADLATMGLTGGLSGSGMTPLNQLMGTGLYGEAAWSPTISYG